MLNYFFIPLRTKAAIGYKVSRKTAYKWTKRYDGSLLSLKDQSRRPHQSPKVHMLEEITLVKRALKKGWMTGFDFSFSKIAV